jgi:hypothetical protein
MAETRHVAAARELAENRQNAQERDRAQAGHILSDQSARVRAHAEAELDLVELFDFEARTRWGRR